jgi:hypothetical protein
MPYVLALAFSILAYVAHLWISDHALAVLSDGGTWTLVASGWSGLLLPILIGGVLPGFIFGLFFGNRYKDEALDSIRQRLREERWEIESQKNELDRSVMDAAAEGRAAGARMALEAENGRAEAERVARTLARQKKALEASLIGARARGERMKKRAQLMSHKSY